MDSSSSKGWGQDFRASPPSWLKLWCGWKRLTRHPWLWSWPNFQEPSLQQSENGSPRLLKCNRLRSCFPAARIGWMQKPRCFWMKSITACSSALSGGDDGSSTLILRYKSVKKPQDIRQDSLVSLSLLNKRCSWAAQYLFDTPTLIPRERVDSCREARLI